jgi:hypothetical protein
MMMMMMMMILIYVRRVQVKLAALTTSRRV